MRQATPFHPNLGDALTPILDRTVTYKRDATATEGEFEPIDDNETTLHLDVPSHIRPLMSEGEIEGGQLTVATEEYDVISKGWLSDLVTSDVAVFDDGGTYDILRVERIATADLTRLVVRKRNA